MSPRSSAICDQPTKQLHNNYLCKFVCVCVCDYSRLICFFMGLAASNHCWKHKEMWRTREQKTAWEDWGRQWEGGRGNKTKSLLLVWVLRKRKSCCSDWCWVAVSHWHSPFLISGLRAAAYRKTGHCHTRIWSLIKCHSPQPALGPWTADRSNQPPPDPNDT